MEKIKNYQVVSANTSTELQKKVMALVAQGWTVTGGSSLGKVRQNQFGGFQSDAEERVLFTQAMIQ